MSAHPVSSECCGPIRPYWCSPLLLGATTSTNYASPWQRIMMSPPRLDGTVLECSEEFALELLRLCIYSDRFATVTEILRWGWEPGGEREFGAKLPKRNRFAEHCETRSIPGLFFSVRKRALFYDSCRVTMASPGENIGHSRTLNNRLRSSSVNCVMILLEIFRSLQVPKYYREYNHNYSPASLPSAFYLDSLSKISRWQLSGT